MNAMLHPLAPTAPILYSEAVREAKEEGAPIVALESTIITHGMPYPENHQTACEVEAEVTRNGAVPATIAVLDGNIHIGLDEEALQQLATTKDAIKLSRDNIAHVLASGKTGSTTVASTMIAARLAEIEVFATGGIGGVHHGGEKTFDISADLQELATSPITVVCAGAKAILDIPKTLEVLETFGVPVMAVGQDEFPAFWSRQSGVKAPLRSDNPEEIARAFRMLGRLGLKGGQLVANPVPSNREIPAEELLPLISQAQKEADAAAITGKGVTPFLLNRLFELTDGRCLQTNVALIIDNARVAAQIAVALKKIPKA